MAELRQNTWSLDEWYAQDVAGNVSYNGDGQLFVWGRGTLGELAQNNRTSYSSPTQVGGSWYGVNVLRRCGYGDLNHTTAVKNDGTLWMWGDNLYGALGLNGPTSDDRSSPAQVGTETTWKGGSPLNKATAVVKTDGTLWSWGFNWGGQLGQNEHDTYYSSPTQIPGTTWSQVGGGNCYAVVVKTNGELWSWGAPHNGKLGNNKNQSSSSGTSSPAQIGTDTTWACVSCMENSVIATKTNGTLWAWGAGGSGQLGQDNTTNRSSPCQIGTDTTWGSTELTNMQGVNTTGSIKTDGTLWMWGDNARGQLGQNQAPAQLGNDSSPRQVGTETTWRSVANLGTGDGAVLATKTNGTLWAWGTNHDGRCAQNSDPDNGGPDSFSSPTQIPGTTWAAMVGGAGGGLAALQSTES